MKKVFMVHGFNGEPNGGWRPWLMGELAKKDIYACALPMPNPEAPIKEEWVKTISEAIGDPSLDIFLVGHSLGVSAIFRYLEKLSDGKKIGGAVLVSGPLSLINKDGYDNVNKFLDPPFSFDHIKKSCNNFAVIHGDDDRSVPFSDAEKLSEILSCPLISIPGGRHLNGSAGWRELPQVLESLENMFK